MHKKTLIIGASEKSWRYSYMAISSLLKHGFEVVAIGNKPGSVEGVEIITGMPLLSDIHTVSLYLNELNQQQYMDYILNLKPKRIIFNPGAENDELFERAGKNGIEAIQACTLVMLSIGNY